MGSSSAAGIKFLDMGFFRVLTGVLGAGGIGLALAERIGASTKEVQIQAMSVEPRSSDQWNATYPSQSESAAILDAALHRSRESARLAASSHAVIR